MRTLDTFQLPPATVLTRILLFTLLFALADPCAAFDPELMQPTTAACDDFYSHANGRWTAQTPVPPGLRSLGAAELLAERSRNDRRTLLEAAAAAPRDDIDAALGTLWTSVLHEPVSEGSLQAAVAPWLKRIDSIAKPRDIGGLLGSAHAAGIPLLFRLQVDVDSGQSDRRIAYALQGGLGLPERDYYLRHESGTVAVREAYLRYVQAVLAKSGDSQPEVNAARVMELETRLARASQSLQQLRDPANSRRLSRVRELEKLYPNMEWRSYLRAQDLRKLDIVSLGHIAFFTEVNALLAQLPVEHWRAYLRFHLLHVFTPLRDGELRQAHFDLFGRAVAGQASPPARWEQALDTAQALLGPELDQRYVQARLDVDRLASAQRLVDALRAALRRRVEVVEWLDQPARTAALAKLDALRITIVLPEPGERPLPRLRSDDPFANVLALLAFERGLELKRIGPVKALPDPLPPLASPWIMYRPERNQLALSPALLQPPLFDPATDDAANLGALGSLIGHELSHAFDRTGARYDAQGQVAPWWGDAEEAAYVARASAMTAQYAAYPAVGPVSVNGRLTLQENLADLAGLEIAFEAFVTLGLTAPPDAEGRSASQRFFLAFAQAGRRAVRDEVLHLTLASELHAPPRWRINGPLANFPAFAATFSCESGKGLLRAEQEQLAIWR